MKFTVDSKILIKNLNDILMRGDYPSGASVSRRNLSPSAYMVARTDGVQLFNADMSTVCSATIPLDTVDDIGECAIVVDTFLNYLKTFKGDVTVEVGDYVRLRTSNKTASFGIAVNHPNYAMIERLRTLSIPTEGMPVFGKNNTPFETKIVVSATDLIDAAKGCDVLKTGRYKFNYDGNEFQLSSNKGGTIQSYLTTIDTQSVEGEQSTVEVTGVFASILNDDTTVYLRDDFPILIVSNNRVLLKAPYLAR